MMTAVLRLKGMLEAAGLPVRGSYRPGEVCRVLGINERSFWRLTERFERDPAGGPVNPNSLDSFLLRRHRRVSYEELVDFVRRNNTWERRNAPDPRQMQLF